VLDVGLVQHVLFDVAALLRIEDLLLDRGVDLQGQRDLAEQLQLLGVVLELLVLVEPAFDLAVVGLQQADGQRVAAAGAAAAAGGLAAEVDSG
jgi:hypothetical protein